MAIFGKDRAQQGTGNGSTVIGAGSDFVGNLTLKDTLHVDGRIDGDVESESNVVIGENGRVEGRITAETVVVSGQVNGSVSAGRLEIIAGGCVEGDVHIVDLVIEPGGRFNGSSEILASRTPETEDSRPSGQSEAAGGEATKSARKKSSGSSSGSSAEAPDRTPSTA
ncbi:MAG: polymer-forming cytoskeletal protein [Wenzhouxiangellaceae bacterium]